MMEPTFKWGGSPIFLSKAVALSSLVVAVLMLAGMLDTADAHSERDCNRYAHQYAAQYTPSGVIGGALTGGLIGGIIGSFSGDFGAGAAIGGGIGAVAGATTGSYRYNRLYWHAYNWCRQQ